MSKMLNKFVEISINDHLILSDNRTRGGHNQAYKDNPARIIFEYHWLKFQNMA